MVGIYLQNSLVANFLIQNLAIIFSLYFGIWICRKNIWGCFDVYILWLISFYNSDFWFSETFNIHSSNMLSNFCLSVDLFQQFFLL